MILTVILTVVKNGTFILTVDLKGCKLDPLNLTVSMKVPFFTTVSITVSIRSVSRSVSKCMKIFSFCYNLLHPGAAQLEPATSSGQSSFSFEKLRSLMEWKQNGLLSSPEFKNAKHQLGL